MKLVAYLEASPQGTKISGHGGFHFTLDTIFPGHILQSSAFCYQDYCKWDSLDPCNLNLILIALSPPGLNYFSLHVNIRCTSLFLYSSIKQN